MTDTLRFETIGAATAARSQISEDQGTVTAETDTVVDHGSIDTENDTPGESDEISRQMEAVDLCISKKSKGSLTLSTIGPTAYSSRVSAHVDWHGRQSDDFWPSWDDRGKGFVKSSHASFDLYRRKRYIKSSQQDKHNQYTDEDYVPFDVESHSKYENVNPGTVSVEGFGMECWDYEDSFGKKRDNTVFVSYQELPNVPGKKLLRRIDELRCGDEKLGWNPEAEAANLKEFFGMDTVHYNTGDRRWDQARLIGDFYSLLNRRDIFADFTSKSSICMEWAGPEEESVGIWNFLWQIIVAKELARRFESYPDISYRGFTHRVLASLIIQDLWLSNVEVILTDVKVSMDDFKRPTLEDRAKAEEFKSKGNEAMKNQRWQDAADFYTKAMEIDLTNAVYRANRSAAMQSMEKLNEAREDAYIATQLDPTYTKAWARLGLAERKLGNGKKARDAYQRAIGLAGNDATSLMKLGLADAKAKIKSDIDAIAEETNKAAREVLRRNYVDQDWDTTHKTPELHSHVHERQVEGLLLFAERMRWPFINEVRDYAEDVYGNLRSGQTVPFNLWDWLFGMTLPGKWMSFKIMAALVHCTPSISHLKVAYYYDCGLSLPKKSYWRVRTVLGRVLGCLPGVTSLCGWIGPCPPVGFFPPLPEGAKKEPRYIRLKARRIAPIEYISDSDNPVIFLGMRRDQYGAIRMRADEDLPTYLAEITNADNWVVPEPPVRELSTCTIQSIQLKKLPLDVNVAAQRANKGINDKEVDSRTEYRASVIFTIDNNEDPVTYTLYTNPIFVTLPPCYADSKGHHEVHLRELHLYQKNIYTVDRLKDHTPEDFDGDVMVINATGKGAEALARTWCSERGKNAVTRRAGGPCYVCAVRAASKTGLDVGILIWVS